MLNTYVGQIGACLADYQAAAARAAALDDAVLQQATKISSQYADLVSLAARQAFGGLEFTISNGTDGNWNTSDVKVFMRDVGSSRCVTLALSFLSPFS